jgi:hypothetical protein
MKIGKFIFAAALVATPAMAGEFKYECEKNAKPPIRANLHVDTKAQTVTVEGGAEGEGVFKALHIYGGSECVYNRFGHAVESIPTLSQVEFEGDRYINLLDGHRYLYSKINPCFTDRNGRKTCGQHEWNYICFEHWVEGTGNPFGEAVCR